MTSKPQREPDYSATGTFEALRSEIARDPQRTSMMLSAPSAQVLVDEYDRLKRLEEQLEAAQRQLDTEAGWTANDLERERKLKEQLEAMRMSDLAESILRKIITNDEGEYWDLPKGDPPAVVIDGWYEITQEEQQYLIALDAASNQDSNSAPGKHHHAPWSR